MDCDWAADPGVPDFSFASRNGGVNADWMGHPV